MWRWLAAFFISGCALLFPAPPTMQSVFDPLPGDAPAKCLLVLLPGALDHEEVFRQRGFIDVVRRSGLSADVVAANATLAYYVDGTVGQRIEADVLGPLRKRGYQQVWLVGVSIGGLGSLQVTQLFPGRIDGILALAPFMASVSLGDEIPNAGGLQRWIPDLPAPLTEKNANRQLWSWLHDVVTGKVRGPELYVGYGDHDGLVGGDRVLASALPKDHVLSASGFHDWGPWLAMFGQFLERSEFQRRCGP